MILTQENKKQIETIIKETDCPKDFQCYKSSFEKLSKVGIVGDAKMVECLEESAKICEFGHSFGLGFICKCPLRNYIARNFRR